MSTSDDVPSEIIDFKRVSTGVGGSYTKWQGKPPSHAVFMVKTEQGWTTVKAYDLTERMVYDDEVRIESGAMGPKNIPFANDVPYDDLPASLQTDIRERIIADFAD